MVRIGLALAAVAVGLPAGSALGASGAETFRMPSGNIYCAYQHYSFSPTGLRCEIRSALRPMPPRPASCRDAAWGEGYWLRPTGPARVLCISDTIYDPKARVLAYGTAWHGGGFTCTSQAAGLRCTSRGGYGFFLSRQHSYAFRAGGNGTFKTPSGNIVCGYGGGFVECGIQSGLRPPPPRVRCSVGDFTDKRVSLTPSGRTVVITCAGDPGPFVYLRAAWVLGYGETWSGDGISCSSAAAGLTCRNRAGHGFFLSRARWSSF